MSTSEKYVQKATLYSQVKTKWISEHYVHHRILCPQVTKLSSSEHFLKKLKSWKIATLITIATYVFFCHYFIDFDVFNFFLL